MNKLKQIKWKNVLLTTVWVVVSCCTLVLLGSAVYKTDHRKCKGINIKIDGVNNHYFIDESDIRKLIDTYCGIQTTGRVVSQFDLRSVEQSLERDIWVKNAELYFDINGVLQVEVDEREPIARIFSRTGGSFYIDSSLKILPLSEKLSARVPVFTGFPTDTRILSLRERNLLVGVRTLSEEILKDSFLSAMIDQVDITEQDKFEMRPKLGDQVVLFGDATGHEEKFRKLKLFYKNVMPKAGWRKYSVIDLSFEEQVVAKIRSKEEVVSDSLRTLELMKMVAEYTERMAGDTLLTTPFVEEKSQDLSMVLQSVQRDEDPGISLTGIEIPEPPVTKQTVAPTVVQTAPVKVSPKPVVKPEVKKQEVKKPEVKKPAVKKSEPKKKTVIPVKKTAAEPPKAVMKKPEPKKANNDY